MIGWNDGLAHTENHINCPACDRSREELMQAIHLAPLPFLAAATLWLESRKLHLAKPSYDTYQGFIKALHSFLGDIPLNQIHGGHFREFQKFRLAQKMGVSCINHECNTLSQILRRAGLWNAIKDQYEPLPTPKWTPPKVLSAEQEKHLFETAASNPNWSVAYWVLTITANTTATAGELRGVRLEHVDMQDELLYVPDATVKNEFRARVIPLNERAKDAIGRLLQRAIKLGARVPDGYLIPFRVSRSTYDPYKPAGKGYIRCAFRELQAAAAVTWDEKHPTEKFPKLTPHCFRHMAITKLLEKPHVSEETVKAIAGHVSQHILRVYSHVRVEAKRKALLGLS